MTKRKIYYRFKLSDVWHFEEDCQFWPPRVDPEQDVVVARHDRPSYGTLCDHCQNIENQREALQC
jgi:hypothetical protein